jgi:outer membrane protein TolC
MKSWLTVIKIVILSCVLQEHAWAEEISEEQFPAELAAWQPSLAAVTAHFNAADASQSQWQEALTATNTQKQKFLPTVSAGANLSRGQSRYFESNNEVGSTPRASELQLNLTLRQNIFNGGADLKRISAAEFRTRSARLKRILSLRNHIRSWLRDIAGIHHQKRVLAFHLDASRQAKALNHLAARKESSGFLGKRDLLDSQRELLRVEQESMIAENSLEELKTRLHRNYGIEFDDNSKFDSFLRFVNYNPVDTITIDSKITSNSATLASLLNVAIARTETQTITADSGIGESARLSPRLDAVAQASQNRRLDGREATSGASSSASSGNFDSSRQWSLALVGEITLNPPTTFGVVEEGRQRVQSAKLNEEKSIRDAISGIENTRLKLKQTRQQKKSAEQLVAITGQMREKNQRLFEAGELSIDRLIAAQQDLNRDRISLASIEYEELLLAMDLFLCDKWNLPPRTSSSPSLP